MRVPISDSHAHVSIRGLGARRLSSKFKEVGGWFIALVSLPPYHYGLTLSYDDLIKSFQIHLSQCDIVRREGLEVACLLGLHPAFVDRLVKEYQGRRDKLLEYVNKSLDVLEKLIRNGAADGLGEFGRPHYKTLPESFALNDYILINALNIVKDYGVPIHLHLESGGVLTTSSIKAIADLLISGKLRKYVVFHHASRDICLNSVRKGFSSTITGKSTVINKVLPYIDNDGLDRVGLESDYIDDPERPGVVMYPWEIANEVETVLDVKPELEEAIHKVLINSVVKIYGVTPP